VKPALASNGIPASLHQEITTILLGDFKKQLKTIKASTPNFFVVDTQGTLRPGHKQDWINEIHPTPSGFKRITKKIKAEIKRQFPALT